MSNFRKPLGCNLLAIVAGMLIASGCGSGRPGERTGSVEPSPRADDALTPEPIETPATRRQFTEPVQTGSIRGRIVFDGPRPAPELLVAEGKAARDAAICAAHSAIMDEGLIVSENGGLANVFIYLDRAPKNAVVPPVPDKPLVLDQKGCVYVPHALIVRTHQVIKVLSDDVVAHNTHTFPKRNDVFNQTIPPLDRDGVELIYRRPELEPVEVKCDLHTWMRAWHLPLDHSFAALTDAKGLFRIEGLPVGKHKFRIWHERAGFLDRAYEVMVQTGDKDLGTIRFPASRFGGEEQP